MPNRAANLLAAVGSLALLAALVVPVLMWPDEFEIRPEIGRLQAVLVGGFLALGGAACWVGALTAAGSRLGPCPPPPIPAGHTVSAPAARATAPR